MNAPFAALLRHTLVALAACALLVVIGYFFVDRAFAFWVHDNGFSSDRVLQWLTYPPPDLQAVAPLAIVLMMIRRAWGPLARWELALLAASVALILADQFRESLSLVFGRYWPETWIDNNPSLIKNGAYGFNWFHWGTKYGSFPSGHMARTVAAAAVIWIAWPRWRWVPVLASIAVAVGLLGMNYHFVSDVIAGSFVGGIVGSYAATCCELSPRASLPTTER